MKDRSVAVKRRTVVLVFLLGSLGLLVPSEAQAMQAPGGSGAQGAVSAGGQIRHQGRHRRHAKAKGKHQKKIGVSMARANGKARPTAKGRKRNEKVACAEAFEKAKETARESHFLAAKEWFARCARPSCGRSLRPHCAALHAEVVAALPSVVPVVTDAADPANRNLEVKMDGELLTSNLDGTAIIVDPGDHEFTFVKDGEVLAKRRLTVEKGQRDQPVSVSFVSRKHTSDVASPATVAEEPAAAPAPRKVQLTDATEESRPVDEEPAPRVVRRGSSHPASVEDDRQTGAPWSAYALAGVGLLGVGGYGVFTLKGRADNDNLVQMCKPVCTPTSVRHLKNTYLAADISLGIGVAALAASTYLFLRTDSGEESAHAGTNHISNLSLEPTSSGALATVGGTF